MIYCFWWCCGISGTCPQLRGLIKIHNTSFHCSEKLSAPLNITNDMGKLKKDSRETLTDLGIADIRNLGFSASSMIVVQHWINMTLFWVIYRYYEDDKHSSFVLVDPDYCLEIATVSQSVFRFGSEKELVPLCALQGRIGSNRFSERTDSTWFGSPQNRN